MHRASRNRRRPSLSARKRHQPQAPPDPLVLPGDNRQVVAGHHESVARLERPEVLTHPPRLDPVPAGQPLDGAFGQAAPGVGLMQEGEPQAAQVGDAGRVRVERPGREQLGVGGPGVVAERRRHGLQQRALPVRPGAVEDRQDVGHDAALQRVPQEPRQEVAHGLIGLDALEELGELRPRRPGVERGAGHLRQEQGGVVRAEFAGPEV
jgi:hypothetical protein